VYSFYNNDIEKIKIESGKIIACDPIANSPCYTLYLSLPTGKFPVQLAMTVIPMGMFVNS
jgi:hypothetical protein